MSKSFVRDLKIYGLADLVTKLLSIICSPFLARLLSQQQFGTMSLLQSVWQPLSLARYGGMDSAYPFFKSRDSEYKEELILFICSLIGILSTIVVVVFFGILGLSNESILSYLQATEIEYGTFSIYILLTSLVYWFVYIFRFQKKPLSYSLYNFFNSTGGILVSIPLILNFHPETRLANLFVSSSIISFFCLCFLFYSFRNLFLQFRDFSLHITLVKQILRYGLILVPPAVLYALSSNLDRILVGYYLGASDVGLIQIALTISSVGGVLVSWFGLAFDPHAIEWIAKKDFNMLEVVSQKSLSVISFVFSSIICMSAIWSHWVIELVYPSAYTSAFILIPFYLIASYFSGVSRVAINTVVIAMKPQVIFYVRLLSSLIAFFVSYFAIPKYGIAFAPISIVISEACILLSWIYLARFYFKNLRLNWNYPMVVICISIIMAISPYFGMQGGSFLYNCILSLILLGLLILPQFVYLRKMNYL